MPRKQPCTTILDQYYISHWIYTIIIGKVTITVMFVLYVHKLSYYRLGITVNADCSDRTV
jgi:hypothetical protein